MLRLALLALLVASSASAAAAGVPIDQATDAQKEAATEAYAKGRTSFDERRFVDALTEFRASYDIVASPNTHLLIAHTLRELGRNAAAYEEFSAVEGEARAAAATDPKYNESVELAVSERAMLREKIGLVTLDVRGADAAATLTVEGRKLGRDAWGRVIALDPGTITFVLTTSAHSVVRELEVRAGAEHTLVIDATVAPSKVQDPATVDWFSTLRVVAYGVAGAGVLSFAAAGGLGGAALSQHDKLQDACGDLPCPDRQDDIDRGRTFQTAANVMLIVGGGLVAAGVVLWFIAPDLDGSAGSGEVAVGVHFNSVTVTGRF